MFEKLLISMRYYLIGRNYTEALKALSIMIEFHGGPNKFRDDGITPEAQHPLEVAHLVRALPNLIYQEETIAAALLHDVPEDYHQLFPHSAVRADFAHLISNAVELVDKRTGDPADRYRRISEDPIASIVKPADRVINNRTMVQVKPTDTLVRKNMETRMLILPAMKGARTAFPQQEASYEILKLMLLSQLDLIDEIVKLAPRPNPRNEG